jgi:two-component system chemotaxis response regulator CheB
LNTQSRKIRALIVDDAVVIRRMLTETLQSDPEIEVVGSASNGKIALMKIPHLKPDIITLDQEMPELSGTETLKILKKDFPEIPVIMFSAFTERGAAVTLEALNLGAADYVTKPSASSASANSKEESYQELIRKIKGLSKKPNDSAPAAAPISTPVATRAVGIKVASPTQSPIDIVAIGVSTGGPNALAKIIPALPENLPVPVLIVQHMPPMFTRLLAERLDSQSALKVVEASEGMPIESGKVYIAPGDYHLEVSGGPGSSIVKLHQGPQENSCRPAVDVLFRSVSENYGARVLSVILTGMGSDGLKGAEVIRRTGGQVIVQDEQSSVVWGMPAYVAEAGIAEAVLPLEQIAQEIIKRVKRFGPKSRVTKDSPVGGTD